MTSTGKPIYHLAFNNNWFLWIKTTSAKMIHGVLYWLMTLRLVPYSGMLDEENLVINDRSDGILSGKILDASEIYHC